MPRAVAEARVTGIWDEPERYELELADDPHFDVDFWTGVVSELAPRRVLELGCGTGRLTFPLAAAATARVPGARVHGVDLSDAFLRCAAARRADQPTPVAVAVSFSQGDLRELQVPVRAYELVALPFNTLAYLLTAADQLACLRAAAAALAPGGRFVFDALVPHLDFLAEAARPCPPVRRDIDLRDPAPGVRRFRRSCADTYDARTQTLSSSLEYVIERADGRVEQRLHELDWHMYFPVELELLLAAAGLRVIERYGDYDRAPFSARSRQYLFVCAAA